MMLNPRKKEKPVEIPSPDKYPEQVPPVDPEEPIPPEEDPDAVPDDDPYETPPYEIPEPGEAP